MIVFADITCYNDIKHLGQVIEVSRSGEKPATHCYVESDAPDVDTSSRKVVVLSETVDHILRASGLVEIPGQREKNYEPSFPEMVIAEAKPPTWWERLKGWFA